MGKLFCFIGQRVSYRDDLIFMNDRVRVEHEFLQRLESFGSHNVQARSVALQFGKGRSVKVISDKLAVELFGQELHLLKPKSGLTESSS